MTKTPITLIVLLYTGLLFGLSAGVAAQDDSTSPPIPPQLEDQPQRPYGMSSLYYGRFQFTANRFVGPYTFSGPTPQQPFPAGPIFQMDFDIDAKYLAQVPANKLVKILIQAFDVDYPRAAADNPYGQAFPEIDYVYLNGAPINTLMDKSILKGEASKWVLNTFEVPKERLVSGKNTITIYFDDNTRYYNTTYRVGPGYFYYTWISYVAIDLGLTPPVFFVHGINSTQSFWAGSDGTGGAIIKAFQGAGLNTFWDITVPNTTIEAGGESLANQIKAKLNALGTNECFIVAHSKGGLWSLAAMKALQSSQINVHALLTLGTPFEGSNLIDRAVGISLLTQGIYLLHGAITDLDTKSATDYTKNTIPQIPSSSISNVKIPVEYITIAGYADWNGIKGIQEEERIEDQTNLRLADESHFLTGVEYVDEGQPYRDTIDGFPYYSRLFPIKAFFPNDIYVRVSSATAANIGFASSPYPTLQSNHIQLRTKAAQISPVTLPSRIFSTTDGHKNRVITDLRLLEY